MRVNSDQNKDSDSKMRGITPVVGVVILIAIVVVSGATVFGLITEFSDQQRDPAPVAGQLSGEFVSHDISPSKYEGGVVTITHDSGEPVQIKNIEIDVDATDACGKTGRLINLPGPTPKRYITTPQYLPFNDGNFEKKSNSIFTQGTGQEKWDAGALHKDTGELYVAGDSFQFRIGKTDCEIIGSDSIHVKMIHTPTNTILFEKTFTANNN